MIHSCRASCAGSTSAMCMLIVPGPDAQELQESEPKPPAVNPFAGAFASLLDLLKRPARGGLARQSDDDSSGGDDSHSIASNSHVFSRNFAEASIKASWADLAEQTAFSAGLCVSSRWVFTPCFYP